MSLSPMDSLSPISDGPSWSKLPCDLLHLVFERLGFADFQRAKAVCSSWQSASRQSSPNNQIPWLILFPEKGKDSSCLLFNPEEKDKMYRIQDLGDNFANSHCLAICGSWFFMQDYRYKLYIMNLFTRERIDLPSVESQLGMIKIERTIDDMFLVKFADANVEYHQKHTNIHLPLFWIDEKTKNYVVIWLIRCVDWILVHSKNGDSFWKQTALTDLLGTHDWVYKDHKLYLYNTSRDVKVLDFSGDIPRQILETQVNYNKLLAKGIGGEIDPCDVYYSKNTRLVATVTGEILRVKSIVRSDSDVWSFRIYKMESSHSEWEKLTSLGDEAIILDLGITVLANAIKGINRNSIYFSGIRDDYFEGGVWSEKDIFVFNLDTQRVERPHRNICSSIQLSDARWFVPNFKPK